MRDFLNTASKTHFLFPIDGDFLNAKDGDREEEGAVIVARVAAAPHSRVLINGREATETESGLYRASICVCEGQNTLCAKNCTDETSAEISVYYTDRTEGKWRISSDDNILFLADITKNQDRYTSIFDNPYLAVYKKAHDLFGACVHLNLFYAFDRAAARFFSEARPDFDLSMMTDRFKAEWEANADWLKLSFHARAEKPDKPYQFASPETITRDFLDVRSEILRFAGEKTFSSDVTTVHWGEANPACVEALRELGHRGLAGYFELNDDGTPLVSYYAPVDLIKHVGERDFWRDHEMEMTFARIDRVTNIGTLQSVMEDLEAIMAHPHRGGFVSVMIHEQYFYKDYVNYLPDFEARVLEPARLLSEHGYKGCLIKDIL